MTSDSPVTIYFHGTPGSPLELQLFGRHAPTDWHALDRVLLGDAIPPKDHFDGIADVVRMRGAGHALRLVGFSLGAWVALAVAARLDGWDVHVDLVSPAGPLGDGKVLERMAGGPLFGAAMRGTGWLAAFAAFQSLLAKASSRLLTHIVLAQSAGDDRALASDKEFRGRMAANLKAALGRDTTVYRREILGYVREDWPELLSRVRAPIRIWAGGSDNWAPPELAERLAAGLGDRATLTIGPGLSHYSCLRAYLSEIGTTG